jgi:hypothetical protein
VGNCESRLLTGDVEIYRELEAKLAAVKKKAAAILFATGFLTNVGVLSSLVRWPVMARVYGYRAESGTFTFFLRLARCGCKASMREQEAVAWNRSSANPDRALLK